MLSKEQRLTTKQFDQVMRSGKAFYSPAFMVKAVSGRAEIRFSAVAPQKIAKTAVLRNRMKRLIYEALRPLLPAVKPGSWAVVITKKDVSNMSPNDILPEIKAVLLSAGLL